MDHSQPVAQPSVQCAEHARCFTELKVVLPTQQIRPQFLHNLFDTFATAAPCQLAYPYYLLTGRTPDNHGMVDTRLMERVQALNHFPKEDQDAILRMIDAITVRSSVQGTLEKIKPKNGTAG
jgi:hypothetical protein